MKWLRVLLVTSVIAAAGAVGTSTAVAGGGLTCIGAAATPGHEGTNASETINGTEGADVIIGGGGDDIIHGNGGLDQICGDDDSNPLTGNDTIYGGTELDLIYPGAGDDNVHGGALGQEDDNVSDQVTYFTASPAVDGVEIDVAAGTAQDQNPGTFIGTDTFEGVESFGGTEHDDTLIGSDDADDFFFSYLGDDLIEGKGGNDLLSFGLSQQGVNVFLEGGTANGEGDDTFSSIEYLGGSELGDFLVGNDDNNVILGGGGDDAIWGRAGNDPLVGGGGSDNLFGGVGELDWAAYEDAPTLPVNVNFTTGLASRADGDDQLFGFELSGGSQGDDVLIGNNGSNFFIADEGNDEIDGGGGDDLVAYFRALNGINADLGAGGVNVTGLGNDTVDNVEQITGTAYDDVLRGTSGNNYINGLDGDDRIFSEGGADYLVAGNGKDRIDGGGGPVDLLDFLNATQEVTADLQLGIASGEGADTLDGLEQLSGSPQGDVLRGDGAANKLLGANGNDKLFGRGGNDAITGQDGNDQIDGAAGKDVCKEKSESTNCEFYKLPKDHPLLEVSRRYKRLEDLDRRYKRRYK